VHTLRSGRTAAFTAFPFPRRPPSTPWNTARSGSRTGPDCRLVRSPRCGCWRFASHMSWTVHIRASRPRSWRRPGAGSCDAARAATHAWINSCANSGLAGRRPSTVAVAPPASGRRRPNQSFHDVGLCLLFPGTPAAGVRLEELLTDVGLSQGETHVLALLADGAAHTVGELQHHLAPPVHIERHPRSSRVPGTDSPRPQHSSTFFVPGRSV